MSYATRKSIITAGSGDYTHPQLWEDDADTYWGSASDEYVGEIQDDEEYTATSDNVIDFSFATTPSITKHAWLTAAPGNRHTGKAGLTHARLRGASAGYHVCLVQESFTRIEYLVIQLDSTGASDEAVRITSGVYNVLLSRDILWTDQTQADTDGVYMGNWSASVYADHLVVYGFTRAGFHPQNYSTTVAATQDWYIDYSTIVKCGAAGEPESGAIFSRTNKSDSVNNIAVYNTAGLDTASTYDDFGEGDGSGGSEVGTTNWSGSHNACTDSSLTSRGLTTGAQEGLTLTDISQSSGNYFVVNETAAGSEDYTLLDDAGGNLAYGNGIDRVGSEPDPRQDFSFDIAGNPHSTTSPGPDIGGSEFTASSATITASHNETGDATTASMVVLSQLTASQNEAGDSAAGSIEALAQVSANQGESGDTTAASLSAQQAASLSVDQAEAGDGTAAALAVTCQVAADQNETGDSAAATLDNVVQLFADVGEVGDSTAAAVNTQQTANVSASQTEEGDSAAASLAVPGQVAATQTETGDSVAASMDNIVQLFADITEAGDSTAAAVSTQQTANLSASQTEAGDSTTAALAVPGNLSAAQTETGDSVAATLGNVIQLFADVAEAGDAVTSLVLTGNGLGEVINPSIVSLTPRRRIEPQTIQREIESRTVRRRIKKVTA